MNIELANTSLYVLPMFRWFCGDLKKGRAVFKVDMNENNEKDKRKHMEKC